MPSALVRRLAWTLVVVLSIAASLAEGRKPAAAAAAAESDELYILLEDASLFSCRGVKNEIKIAEEDVVVTNEKGNRVHFIKAPGNYSLHFRKINVLNEFRHLTGEIGVTLQVPILEGAGVRFDVPYTMIPETGLLSQQCDEFSGIVERDKRQYCRYCELCGLTEQIEQGLNKGGHQFLPELAKGEEKAFAPQCGRINSDSYEFKRTINLPGRRELEGKIKQKISGVDAEIRKRLNKGRGRFQVYLNLISANQPPITQKNWFDGSDQCRCCGRTADPSCRNVLNFLYCNVEECKSAWAQQCLHNSARIVACYTAEFNYQLTTNYDEVLEFLRSKRLPNQEVGTPRPTTALPIHPIADDASVPARCVARMSEKQTHLRRYCTIFWNEKLCCPNCAGVCS